VTALLLLIKAGIALGSLVAAGPIVFLLGGLIYHDIVRRDPRLTGHAPA